MQLIFLKNYLLGNFLLLILIVCVYGEIVLPMDNTANGAPDAACIELTNTAYEYLSACRWDAAQKVFETLATLEKFPVVQTIAVFALGELHFYYRKNYEKAEYYFTQACNQDFSQSVKAHAWLQIAIIADQQITDLETSKGQLLHDPLTIDAFLKAHKKREDASKKALDQKYDSVASFAAKALTVKHNLAFTDYNAKSFLLSALAKVSSNILESKYFLWGVLICEKIPFECKKCFLYSSLLLLENDQSKTVELLEFRLLVLLGLYHYMLALPSPSGLGSSIDSWLSTSAPKHYANGLHYFERSHEKFREQAIFPIWLMANCYFFKKGNTEDLGRAHYYYTFVARQFYFLNLKAIALLHLGLFKYQDEEYIDAKYYFEQAMDLIVSLKLHILWRIYGELLLLELRYRETRRIFNEGLKYDYSQVSEKIKELSNEQCQIDAKKDAEAIAFCLPPSARTLFAMAKVRLGCMYYDQEKINNWALIAFNYFYDAAFQKVRSQSCLASFAQLLALKRYKTRTSGKSVFRKIIEKSDLQELASKKTNTGGKS